MNGLSLGPRYMCFHQGRPVCYVVNELSSQAPPSHAPFPLTPTESPEPKANPSPSPHPRQVAVF